MAHFDRNKSEQSLSGNNQSIEEEGGLETLQILRRAGRVVTIDLVDDLDGGVASETVSFELDGSAYEIDLSKANADGLRQCLRPYAESSREGIREHRGRTTLGLSIRRPM